MHTEQKNKIDYLLFIILTIMYTVAYNRALRTIGVLWFGISGLAVAYMGLILIKKRIVTIKFVDMWFISFYMFGILSITWSIKKTFPDSMKSMLLIYIVAIMISLIAETRKDLMRLLFANYIALILCAMYIVVAVDPSMIGEARVGSAMENMWNSNAMSATMCFGLVLSVYYIISSRSKLIKLIHIASFVLFAIVVFMSGSRTGLLLMTGIIVMTMLITAKGAKIVGAIIGAVAFVALIYYLVMNVEILYNVLGNRLEDMIMGVTGEGEADGSFNIRSAMISYGIEWFKESPIWGYGIDNYRYLLLKAMGLETYSHNTFIEIAVSGGILGFALYYSIYAFILVKLWKPAYKEKDKLSICLFVMTLTKLIMQVSSITYYSTDANTMIILATCYIHIRELEKRKEMAIENEIKKSSFIS